MKRRDFLKLSSMASIACTINGMPLRALGEGEVGLKSRGVNGNILVLIRLNGGNDGLNTVIPLDKYSQLSAARSNVLIPASSVLSLNGTTATGFHPAMVGLRTMFNEGKLNIIQGVSYPDPNFSHFRSTDIMNSASDSNVFIESGWIGRFLDNRFPGAPQSYPNSTFTDPLSIEIGSTVSSLLSGNSGLNGLAISNINSFYQIVSGTVDPAPNTPAGMELTFIRLIAQQTQAYTQVIQNAANLGTNSVTYNSNNRLAQQLKIVAKLISGGLKTPVYIVNMHGFDTHDNQVDTTSNILGEHANLLGQFSEAVSTFQKDLELQHKDKKVTGCVITEFGRRIKSNASKGTDHGSGVPMFVFGSNVNPGFIGTNPNLPPNATVDDNVPMQYDFRQIYSTILSDWFGLAQNDVLSVMNGQSYQWLPIFKWATPVEQHTFIDNKLDLNQNYPNPFREHTTIRFVSEGGAAQIILYDDMGRRVRILYENHVPKGPIEVNVDRNGLPAGNYFYQLQVGNSVKLTKKMVVVN